MASPIIKWVGGKTRFLPELVKRMPRSYNRYFEPFAGGAALFFHLEPQCPAFLSDVNADLIAMYRAVRDEPEAVIQLLQVHARLHDDHHYRSVRGLLNAVKIEDSSPTTRAAMFIYLNKTCFNGLWRVNKLGEFNVPMGDNKNPKICDAAAIRAASKALSRTMLAATDWFAAVRDVPGDFVYFDPPYHPVTETSNFTAYDASGFGQAEQRRLARVAQALVSNGVQVMLSNSDTPLVRELYSWARICTVQRSGSINSDPNKRGKVNEVIITGGYEHGA